MVTINLLPPEFRKAERTPFVIFLPIIAGLICVLSAGAVAGYVRFSWLAEKQAERATMEGTMREKKPRLEYHTKLLQEEAEYQKQAKTITEIASGRILMTKKLDELCALIGEGDAGQHGGYKIWLQEVKVKPERGNGRRKKKTKGIQPAGSLEFKGFALADSSPLQDFNAFHRAIKNSEMFRTGFLGMTDPDGKVVDFSDGLSPAKGWSFGLAMVIADPAGVRKELEKMRIQAQKEARRKRSR